jgi:hypothetical protein
MDFIASLCEEAFPLASRTVAPGRSIAKPGLFLLLTTKRLTGAGKFLRHCR